MTGISKRLGILLTFSSLCIFQMSFKSGPSVAFNPNSVNSIENAWYLDDSEKAMLRSINRIRTQPKAYLEVVLARFEEVMADSAQLSTITSEVVTTQWVYHEEGLVKTTDTTYRDHFRELKQAYLSLIEDLKKQSPLHPLQPHPELKKAAEIHAKDQIPQQYIQHWGTDGSWPLDRIQRVASWSRDGNENIAAGEGDHDDILLQLMVDSGVKGYGHRKNLLSPGWTYVACHRVDELSKGNFAWWIQEFAR